MVDFRFTLDELLTVLGKREGTFSKSWKNQVGGGAIRHLRAYLRQTVSLSSKSARLIKN